MSNSPESEIKLSPTLTAMQRLIDVVAQLRSPVGGCPWDLAQTPESLIPYIIEEAYETVDAIKNGDKSAISEELGDLLLQVVLQAQIAQEYGQFDLAEITNGIADKLMRRHPHVFANLAVESMAEVQQNWEQIKAEEKGETIEQQKLADKLSRYARSLPPLSAGMKISEKAAKVGFDWDNIEGVWQKIEEEIAEFKEALEEGTIAEQQGELGDILFAIIQLARWYNLDASAALQETNQKFIERFAKVEAFASKPLSDHTIDELENLWQQAKILLAKEK